VFIITVKDSFLTCIKFYMKHLNIRVLGQVQGVGFRYSARSVARFHNIKGFARNEPDGSVYIEAEGEDENIRKFTDWCRTGPGGGRVEELVISEGNARGFERFEIKFI
jgi:acylphosphatase